MSEREWEIPPNLQPDPADYRFDLPGVLRTLVGIRSLVPSDAFTAEGLGTERTGSGVVIRPDGLVLTIGYIVTEAETLWLTDADGRAIPGHALAYDQTTGFGLVQALAHVELPAIELGDDARARPGTTAVMAAAGGPSRAIETRISGRDTFAGYWEYLLEDAIFTAPAHPFWGGAALIGDDGRLLGIGSLVLQQGDDKGQRHDMNMVVPIGLLPPILDDLLTYGRVNRPARPWLGLYATEGEDGISVGGLANDGPAEQAGLRVGDRLLAVGREEVGDLASLWRAVWACGDAGATVPLRVRRRHGSLTMAVVSADRASFLKAPRLH
ncbi:S1C family serine protease [Roseomonas sp. NAR14]|uniref:S1C family serine protease n=1 Tax=Roseomonas acroporae TaxID=2937791 RepID=A0A9X2BS87_9PROT|nr:S1C family serine protease [Roseomonas acroporae]MCK8783313.1 S1C family serine protease [Roseomonas acroporae]